MSSSRDRGRLRDLRRRHLVAKLVDVDLLVLAQRFDIPDDQIADDEHVRRVKSERPEWAARITYSIQAIGSRVPFRS